MRVAVRLAAAIVGAVLGHACGLAVAQLVDAYVAGMSIDTA